MMKKLIVLLCVLIVTSTASATISLTVSQPSTESLAIEVTGTIDQDLYIVLSSNGTLGSYALGVDAPDLSGYAGPTDDLTGTGFDPPAGFSGQYWVMATSDNINYPITGEFLTALGGAAGDQVNIRAFDETVGYLGDFGTITLVPEPMTIALLGLGGLFLRRRK
ncbi:MAG: PEP-CTERM sorting domain-containing protein [Phycisphaerae bacterium]